MFMEEMFVIVAMWCSELLKVEVNIQRRARPEMCRRQAMHASIFRRSETAESLCSLVVFAWSVVSLVRCDVHNLDRCSSPRLLHALRLFVREAIGTPGNVAASVMTTGTSRICELYYLGDPNQSRKHSPPVFGMAFALSYARHLLEPLSANLTIGVPLW